MARPIETYFPQELPIPVIRHPNEAREAFPSIETVETAFSDQLQGNVRYERYKNGETLGEWVELLGPDVLFLTHPGEAARHTYGVVATQEAYGRPIGPKLKTMLYTVPWLHDWGELKVEGQGVGDVSYDKKTDGTDQAEADIFGAVTSFIPNPNDRDIFRSIYSGIVRDPNSPLGKMFRAAESVGYIETAIRAYLGNGKRISNWQGLCGNVLQNMTIPLLALRQQHPYVDIFMSEHERIIDGMFNDTEGQPIPFDSEGSLSYNPDRYNNALTAWKNR